MGVPALFRWLSKKYPKIVRSVEEVDEPKVTGEDGSVVTIPVDITGPNPNGEEYDNLYLDMNGIVHPCTHPEGKPAPETEEEMMVEIFSYTERVVNMVRPRKLLFMAIDGVAPRAKMNQQRSRRFRSSQEAKDKEEARRESLALWESMGKTVTEEQKNVTAWDSNAITPGTPFMELLAASLRYWVARKMNTDPGWKNIQVIISDASVPGEGEHKIMDFIRRQRTNAGHDPNTKHVIYGLDADLIMLALATHEPHFRVLREDVFFQGGSANACRRCGQDGHYAMNCPVKDEDLAGVKKPKVVVEKKPFIFLDVSILREYLEAELRIPQQPFPFNFEQAIDDWVLLIFFVGNDFLPHLPSLEIREGAIDTLLKIWRHELPRMGGYLTNNGRLELARAQIILEGLARREDDIFQRRREAELRQDQNAKRRKIEQQARNGSGPASSLNLSGMPSAPPTVAGRRTSGNDLAANADSIGLGGPQTSETAQHAPLAAQALAGSNRDVVANRRAIRMANMSAAEVLKAELAGLQPLKPSASSLTSTPTPAVPAPAPVPQPEPVIKPEPVATNGDASVAMEEDDNEVPGLGGAIPVVADTVMDANGSEGSPHGVKRTHDVVEAEDAEIEPDAALPAEDDDEADPDASASYAFKVNPDGTVVQEDNVRFWESGYKERYYKQKFGIDYSDVEMRKKITTKYVEGMAWVLQYYYQGTPSWQWYYPYHFAPFAADFDDVAGMKLDFQIGQPFKPFEQLMGVFPAASRVHIPAVFHDLMTNEDSPIIDFYPEKFDIDMNGKRMAWQGVALLPFIDEKRLLDAMAPRYPQLSEGEVKRNLWGNDVIFAFEENPLYPSLEALYGKRKSSEPVPINTKASRGMSGSLLPDPDCLPGSTYVCPLEKVGLPDIKADKSLSALYFFPKQLSPHTSVLLPGLIPPTPKLNERDRDMARRGGERGGDRGGYRGRQNGPPDRDWGQGYSGNQHGGRGGSQNGSYNGSRDSHSSHSQSYGGGGYPPHSNSYPPQQSYGQNGGYRGRGGGGGGYNSYDRGGRGRGGYDNSHGGSHGGNSYGQSYGNGGHDGGSYGGYGGYGGDSRGGGYGGGGRGGGYQGGGGRGRGGSYGGGGGGYGGQQQDGGRGGFNQGSYGNSYNNNSRGGYNGQSRGRGGRW